MGHTHMPLGETFSLVLCWTALALDLNLDEDGIGAAEEACLVAFFVVDNYAFTFFIFASWICALTSS